MEMEKAYIIIVRSFVIEKSLATLFQFQLKKHGKFNGCLVLKQD